jgi:hypothetical protein
MENKPFLEKRKYVRKPVSTDIDLTIWRMGGEDFLKCDTRDISVGGAFLNTGDIRNTKTVPIHMRLVNKEEEIHNPIYLKVIRKTAEGTAVEFRSLGINEFAAVQKILA